MGTEVASLSWLLYKQMETDSQTQRIDRRSSEGRGAKALGGKGDSEGTQGHRLAVTNSHGDVEHSRGNTVNTTVITMYAARWELDFLGGHVLSYINL